MISIETSSRFTVYQIEVDTLTESLMSIEYNGVIGLIYAPRLIAVKPHYRLSYIFRATITTHTDTGGVDHTDTTSHEEIIDQVNNVTDGALYQYVLTEDGWTLEKSGYVYDTGGNPVIFEMLFPSPIYPHMRSGSVPVSKLPAV